MNNSFYHSLLRTSALTLSLVLLFVSGVISPVTRTLSEHTTNYLASAVGMYAAVEPNGINEVTAALTAKENALNEREAALAEREIAVGVGGGVTAAQPDYATYILSIIVFILLVLMVINYVLDYLRATPVRPRQTIHGSSV